MIVCVNSCQTKFKISNEGTATLRRCSIVFSISFELVFAYINIYLYVVRYVIYHHVHNLKDVRNTHGGVLLLVKLQAEACNFTKSNTPPWVFFTFLKLHDIKSRKASHILMVDSIS